MLCRFGSEIVAKLIDAMHNHAFGKCLKCFSLCSAGLVFPTRNILLYREKAHPIPLKFPQIIFTDWGCMCGCAELNGKGVISWLTPLWLNIAQRFLVQHTRSMNIVYSCKRQLETIWHISVHRWIFHRPVMFHGHCATRYDIEILQLNTV